MNSKLVFTGGTIVTRAEAFRGTVYLENGFIQSIDQKKCPVPDALDLEGDYLLPGLIERHTDNMEKHMAPRPEVLWPSPLTSFLVHDNQIAGAGITTVLDCLFLGAYQKTPFVRALGSRLFPVPSPGFSLSGSRGQGDGQPGRCRRFSRPVTDRSRVQSGLGPRRYQRWSARGSGRLAGRPASHLINAKINNIKKELF